MTPGRSQTQAVVPVEAHVTMAKLGTRPVGAVESAGTGLRNRLSIKNTVLQNSRSGEGVGAHRAP